MSRAEQQSFDFDGSSRQTGTPNFVVEAGAGTGKTTRIVRDVVRLLLERPDLDPARVVLVTFTEKAAAEIAERVHAGLTEIHRRIDHPRICWPSEDRPIIKLDPSERERWRSAVTLQLGQIERLRSQTIHSFCQSILRMHPLAAGIDPQFEIIEGFERVRLLREVFERWRDEETLRGSEEHLADWMAAREKFFGLDALFDAIGAVIVRRELLEDPSLSPGDVSEMEPYVLPAVDELRALGPDWMEKQSGPELTLVRFLKSSSPPAGGSLEEWIDWLEPIADTLRSCDLRRLKSAGLAVRLRGKSGDGTLYDQLIAHRAAVALRALALRYLAAVDAEKQARGVVDYDDLLHRTARVLERADIRSDVRSRYDAIFVDEFQDTDRMQAVIIDRLARDDDEVLIGGRTTLVGDPKQSIYSFRRADPETFVATLDRFVAEGAERDYLDSQYRSDPRLVESLNAMFGALFADARSTASPVPRPVYQPLKAGRPHTRDAHDPPIRFLAADCPADESNDWAEAEMIASWVERRRDGGSDIRGIAILMRKMTNAAVYAEVFARRGVPLVLPPGRSLLEHPASVELMTVLRAIARPFDRGAMISAARSRYFALSDDEIAAALLVEGGDDQAYRTFTATIQRYGLLARDLPLSRLVEMLIDDRGIGRLYRLLRDGTRSIACIDRIVAMARQFELHLGGSPGQFVMELERRRTEGDEAEPPWSDSSADGVRMMTVHASKGLEFDTVILPDLGGRGGGDRQKLFAVDEPPTLVMHGTARSLSSEFRTFRGLPLREIARARDEAELERLFYVAVTRARHQVVFVSSPLPKNKSSFWKPLSEIFSMSPPELARLFPAAGETSVEMLNAGTGTIAVEFERMEPPHRDGSRPSPFIDDAVERASIRSPIVQDQIPIAPARLDRAEIAIRRAALRKRDAGVALHRCLELWTGEIAELDRLLERIRRESALTPESLLDLRKRMSALATSPRLQRLIRAEDLGREVPISYRDEAGTVRAGRIDRLLRDGGSLLVLDYKRGKPSASRLENDRMQVSGYCAAVAAMSGEPVLGALWYIDLETDEWVDVE